MTIGPTDAEAPHAGSASTPPAWVRLEDQLAWYDGKSGAAQGSSKRAKTLALVVAATVPVLAGLSAPAPLTAALAAVVVVAEGLMQLNQWHTNWLQYRRTAEALKHEKYLYLSRAGPYSGPDADRVLAERVEALVSQEHAKWIEARSHPDSEDQRP